MKYEALDSFMSTVLKPDTERLSEWFIGHHDL